MPASFFTNSSNLRARRVRQGVTLIELLVAMFVLAVLLAITVPVLRGARASTHQAISLSNLRANAQRFHAHAAERGVFPVAAPTGHPGTISFGRAPVEDYVVLKYPDGGGLAFYYFNNDWNWSAYLVSLGDEPATPTWYSPSLGAVKPGDMVERYGEMVPAWWMTPAHYLYSHAFMAGPEYFTPGVTPDRSMWRAVRPDEVAGPSRKALLFEIARGVSSRFPGTPTALAPTPIAFADGHSEALRFADAAPGVPDTTGLLNSEIRLLRTLEGVLGRDF